MAPQLLADRLGQQIQQMRTLRGLTIIQLSARQPTFEELREVFK